MSNKPECLSGEKNFKTSLRLCQSIYMGKIKFLLNGSAYLSVSKSADSWVKDERVFCIRFQHKWNWIGILKNEEDTICSGWNRNK